MLKIKTFIMDKSDISKKLLRTVTGVTNINVSTLRYDWTINNYDVNDMRTGEVLKSPIFSESDESVYKWFLNLYPEGEYNTGYISLFLVLAGHSECKPPKVKFTFCVLNQNRNEKLKTSSTVHHCERAQRHGYRNYVKIDTLKQYILNNSLIIRCDITTTVNIEHLKNQIVCPGDNCVQKLELDMKSKILNRFESLFCNHEFSDIIITAGEKKFHAHKAILGAHSPVFLAMFKHNMKEKQNCEVKVEDVNQNVVQEFLRFIYCGKIQHFENVAQDLLYVADKYAIDALKTKCEQHFGSKLNIDNAIQLVVIADRYNAVELKKKSINFLVQNKKHFANPKNLASSKNIQLETIVEITKALFSG